MELIPVGDNKLKIMLTLSDMTRFEIPEGAPDIPCEQIRARFPRDSERSKFHYGFQCLGGPSVRTVLSVKERRV